MSLSKLIQINNQILLSYDYDNYATDSGESLEQEYSLSYHLPYVVEYNDGTLGYIDTYGNSKEIDSTRRNTPTYQRFTDSDNSTYYWPGYFVKDEDKVSLSSEENYNILDTLYKEGHLKSVKPFRDCFENPEDSPNSLYYDTLKIYLISGYMLNSIEGFSIKVKARKNSSEHGEYTSLLDFVFIKDRLKDLVEWIPNPMYMNSRFYDRVIQIKIPSPYALSRLGKNSLDISRNLDIYLEFSTISPGFLNAESPFMLQNSDIVLTGTSSFVNDATVQASIRMNTNSDYFNVSIYQDKDTGEIIYYPTYGIVKANSEGVIYEYPRPLNYDVMSSIESGRILMYSQGFNDVNTEIDSFDEIYSQETFQWCILNELNVRYVYQRLNQSTQEIETYIKNQNSTNLIDYTGKSERDGEFWKTRFFPIIEDVQNYELHSIIVAVQCHLVNRMNGAEVIRTASITVTDLAPYSMLKNIETKNMITWKIFNKIENNSVQVNPSSSSQQQSQISKIFYESNSIVMQEDSNYMSQGKATLYLYKTDHYYKISLFKNSSTGTQIPYSLTGPYEYVLAFPTVSGNRLEIIPTYSSNMSLSTGQIEYFLSESQVKMIMAVEESSRYFAIMCKNSNKTYSTIYQGKVSFF